MGALFLNTLVFLASSQAHAHALTVAPKDADEATQDEPTEDEEAAQPTLARCVGPMRLVAAVFIEARPHLSLAVLRNQGGARVLPLGGRLDDLVLVAVRPHHAELRTTGGELCVLSVFGAREPSRAEAAQPVAPKPSPREKKEPKGRAMFTPQELDEGLRHLGGDTYAITRELLQKALTNPGGAASGAHFRQAERDGQSIGMEVRGVRDGSPLSRMGVRSGDVVRSVNGSDLTTPLGLLDALRKVREADNVTFSIVREGGERALRYLVE